MAPFTNEPELAGYQDCHGASEDYRFGNGNGCAAEACLTRGPQHTTPPGVLWATGAVPRL